MRRWRHKSESLPSPETMAQVHALFILPLVIFIYKGKLIISQSAQIFTLKDVGRVVDIQS